MRKNRARAFGIPRIAVALLGLSVLGGCGGCEEETPVEEPEIENTATAGPSLSGRYRAVMRSQGGELPFFVVVDGERGVIENAEERVAIDSIIVDPAADSVEQYLLRIERYDATLRLRRVEGGAFAGEWSKTTARGDSRLAVTLSPARENDPRFLAPDDNQRAAAEGAAAVSDVTGSWRVVFREEDGSEDAARGEFQVDASGGATGTFLTSTGDYRYLDGEYRDGLLRLSCFDGSHAFLFHARAQADGTLQGDFWSRDVYHATFTARRLAEDERVLPDPYAEVHGTHPQGLFRFDFEDLEGERVTERDERFAGKVVVLDVFGTWCPNCNDAAVLLSELHERYHEQGLEVVGLAFEYTGDVERDRRQLRTYAREHDVSYPLLLAGVSRKSTVREALPDLSDLKSYPTTIFVGRDGRARHFHSGFAGPATGEHYTALRASFIEHIEALLAEPAP